MFPIFAIFTNKLMFTGTPLVNNILILIKKKEPSKYVIIVPR